MPKILEHKVLPYSSEDIFNLVINVEDYPEFLPWAQSAKVYNKTNSGFDADLGIGYKMFAETYTSKVEFFAENPSLFQIKTNATHGPFEYLNNEWEIKPLDLQKCDVKFSLNFEFKNNLLGGFLTPIFQQATQKMIEAFEQRAEHLYGKK